MAGDYGQEVTAFLIAKLYERLTAIERRLSIETAAVDLEDESGAKLSSVPPGESVAKFFTTQVLTPDSANSCFTARIVFPTNSTSKWTTNNTFTTVFTVDVPTGITVPENGAIVGIFNTGMYDVNKPRYAIFGAGGGAAKQFRFKEMFNDYYRCREWDGAEEGAEDVFVAKPYYLRATPFDGNTVNGITYTFSTNHTFRWARNSLTPVSTVRQIIVPYYATDDLVYAAESANGTSIVVSGSDVTFQDMNVDGRFWVRD